MMISTLTPRGARSLALALVCTLGASCAGTPKELTATPVQSVAMGVTYEVGSDVALAWLDGGSLAMVADDSLAVLEGDTSSWKLPIEAGTWPVELTAGGDLLAVCFPEQRIEIYQLVEGDLPLVSTEPDTLGETLPIVTIEISSIGPDPFDQSVPSPRLVFAMRKDGNLIAMTGPAGNVFFANPRTGWPNPVVSIRLPKDSGIPMANRFRGANSVDGVEGEMVVTTQLRDGSLVEWTLNPELTLWSEPNPVDRVDAVDGTGATRTFVTPGTPARVTSLSATGELLWRGELSAGSADALAVGAMGKVAVATDGKLIYLEPRDQRSEP
ncbi:MAG: hypothetical protein P8N31_11610 [Planctomycetota bacterium]|mgnify:FL=1|nr:hypothetical protein [Planctomycetota bacterium]MDG2144195.1 hypothetical protein [Planctomycetota bacterium]